MGTGGAERAVALTATRLRQHGRDVRILCLERVPAFEGQNSALVGRANRWCHWKDMLYLREQGIRTYDMGGIAVGAEAAAVSGINDFKIRFGGTTVREDHWLSPLYYLASIAGAK